MYSALISWPNTSWKGTKRLSNSNSSSVCKLSGIDVHADCALTCSSSSSSKIVMASMLTAHEPALPCGMVGGRAGIVQVIEAKQLQQQAHGCSMHVESGICCVSTASCHRRESCQKLAGEAKAATSASTQGLASNKADACLSNHSCMPTALWSHLEELFEQQAGNPKCLQQQRHTDLTFNLCASFTALLYCASGDGAGKAQVGEAKVAIAASPQGLAQIKVNVCLLKPVAISSQVEQLAKSKLEKLNWLQQQ